MDLLVVSPQGMSCGFASCKPTGGVSVDLLVASPQGMSVWIC